MERRISAAKYLLAFLLTLLVFSGGIIIGVLFEAVRLNDSRQINLEEKANLKSLQLQQGFVNSGVAECKVLNQILERNIAELDKQVDLILDYEKRAVLNNREFNLQLRDYFLTEIQFLVLSREIDQECARDHVKVLFFYDEDKQDTQGRILDYLKTLFGPRVLIFSFDSGFNEEPMIKLLLTTYKINKFPAVVVEDRVFQGPATVKQLLAEICAKMPGSLPPEC
ncbi:hypothetical protein J4479_05090 [Candidatus Woesearchaeota archaeon]|nr:hypothetical protein [Candidatus Woesearchaeota archaeon]